VNDVQKQIQKQLYETYHELHPVVEAFEKLLAALDHFAAATGNWPPIHLGRGHYRHALDETIRFQAEAKATAEGMAHVFERQRDRP